MKKSQIDLAPNYFDRYIQKIPDISWREAMRTYGPELYERAINIFLEIGDRVYDEQKWTIKQIIQHVMDTERIMFYRALSFARRDAGPLPGFDENLFADHADVSHRSLHNIMDEYKIVRQSGMVLFESFNEHDLMAKGSANQIELSTLSIAFIVAGHAVHHMEVIRDRYFPLVR